MCELSFRGFRVHHPCDRQLRSGPTTSEINHERAVHVGVLLSYLLPVAVLLCCRAAALRCYAMRAESTQLAIYAIIAFLVN